MKKIECFKVRICKADSIFDSENWMPIIDLVPKYNGLFAEPTTILADPFLFVKDDSLFLFYEDKKMYHDGVISMIKTTDLVHWTDPVVVLKESCHLSYPWVFEENGQIYMIPETSGLKSIRLYEANEDLTHFKFIKTILHDTDTFDGGFSFSDSSIFKLDNKYYLITTINNGCNNMLKLYVSNYFDGGYIEHPQSVITSNNKYARNAGSMFRWENQLFRVAQDCEYKYGDNVHLLTVTELTPDLYKERVLKENILSSHISFYKEGGHQFNFVNFKGKNIIATDAKEYHNFIFKRIMHKLWKYI